MPFFSGSSVCCLWFVHESQSILKYNTTEEEKINKSTANTLPGISSHSAYYTHKVLCDPVRKIKYFNVIFYNKYNFVHLNNAY